MGFGILLLFFLLVFVVVRILGGPGAFVGGGCCGGHNYGEPGGPHDQINKQATDPAEIVRIRFAKGEISREEFEQISATLHKN